MRRRCRAGLADCHTHARLASQFGRTVVQWTMAVELLSVSPSPSRDQDVFGKELRLSGEFPVLACRVTIRSAQLSQLAGNSIQCNALVTLLWCCVEAERKQLSAAGDIFLSKTVHIDTHSKKGDGTEPRTLVSEWAEQGLV